MAATADGLASMRQARHRLNDMLELIEIGIASRDWILVSLCASNAATFLGDLARAADKARLTMIAGGVR